MNYTTATVTILLIGFLPGCYSGKISELEDRLSKVEEQLTTKQTTTLKEQEKNTSVAQPNQPVKRNPFVPLQYTVRQQEEEKREGLLKYREHHQEIIITGCHRSLRGELVIPSEINGLPVTEIGSKAFYYDREITKVSIPATVTKISFFNFAACSKLSSIEVDNANPSFASIDGILFSKDLKTLIQVPALLEGDYEIPEHVTTLGRSAFYGCGLRSISVPSSVKEAGTFTFGGTCLNIESVHVDSGNAILSSIEGVLFNKDKTKLIFFPRHRSDEYSVPEGVVEIGSDAFYNCNELVKVQLPQSLERLGNSVFLKCYKLRDIELPPNLVEMGSGTFAYCAIPDITIPPKIQEFNKTTFRDCKELKSITISSDNPYLTMKNGVVYSKEETVLEACLTDQSNEFQVPDSVLEIKACAFSECSHLTKIILPPKLTRLERHVLNECTGLTSIVIPEGVTRLEHFAFLRCKNLEAVTFLGNSPELGQDVFGGCPKNLKVYYSESATGFSSPEWNGFESKECTNEQMMLLVKNTN